VKVALLAGATGLVGGQCLEQLLETPDYGRVIALTRRPLAIRHAKLDQRIIDFDQLGREGTDFPTADDVFCCLGTTMKRAGSEAAFRQVDFVYVVSLAGQALARGAKQFLLVSSLGANAKSPIFYSRVKGEAEAAIAALSFEGRQIFRPSILTGERAEHRPGERAGIAVMRGMSFAMIGPLRKYRPIAARTVARAMIRVARQAPRGVNIFASNDIERLGRD
jgi:uncharacterized protein YbjT (DUF2867 family)